MKHIRTPSRRRFLQHTGGLAIGAGLAALSPQLALANVSGARSLSFDHTHTGEHLSLVYALGDQVLPQAQATLNHFLRDHYTGLVGVIDPQLFGLLFALRRTLGTESPFQVISGYRSPVTNARLRRTGGGGVAKHSLHMDGKAIDIRLPAWHSRTCAMPRCRSASAASGSMRARTSCTWIPAACATGLMAR